MKTVLQKILLSLIAINLFGQKNDLKNNEQSFFESSDHKSNYKKYGKSEIKKFENYIIINDSIKIRFDKNTDTKYKQIIENGFLSPENSNKVNDSEYCCFQELYSKNQNPKIKRFKFWIYLPKTNNPLTNRINPDEYYFELYNENATEKTNFDEFLKNAKLTFIKFKTIVL
ncbi:hypothetical protein AAH994_15330 [Weeksellaceae bacterium A-14]